MPVTLGKELLMDILISAVIAIIAVAMIAVTIEFLIPSLILWLGKQDKGWNPVRILPPPGEMFLLVKGDPDGPYSKLIHAVPGFKWNEAKSQFEDETGTPKNNAPTSFWENFLAKLGVTWVGLWKYFLWKKISYDKYERDPKSSKWELVPKTRGVKDQDHLIPSIFFRYNMATKIKSAETKGNFPVDALIVFTVQMTMPIQAFFFSGGWETQTTAAVQGVFRQYVSTKDIDELRQEQVSKDESLVKQIKALNNGSDGLLKLFGVEITDAKFVEFDLTSGDEEMVKATKALQIATLNAKAKEKDGEGEKLMRKNRAEGVEAEVKAWGANPVGGQVAMAEAIKEARPTVIGGNVIANVETVKKESK